MKTVNIIITGIPGAGKTTILQEMLTKRPHLTIFNYGDEMIKIAAGQQIDRDALLKLPIPEQHAIGLLAAQKIVSQATGITLIDTLALVKTPMGYMPGFPYKILQILQPSAIASIESSPLSIHGRRQKNKTRFSDDDPIDDIEYYQELCRAYVTACSAMVGATLIFIQNEADATVAAHQLLEAIEVF